MYILLKWKFEKFTKNEALKYEQEKYIKMLWSDS